MTSVLSAEKLGKITHFPAIYQPILLLKYLSPILGLQAFVCYKLLEANVPQPAAEDLPCQ